MPAEQVVIPRSTLLGEPRHIDPRTPIPRLLDFDPDRVVRIRLTAPGTRELELSREGSTWRGATDTKAVEEFLKGLREAARIDSMGSQEANLADYGLDRVDRRAVLDLADGRAIMVEFGDRSPAGTAVYVRVNQQEVALTGALVLWEFDKFAAKLTGSPLPT